MNPATGPFADTLEGITVLHRYGRSEEVAGLVSYLASPEAGFVSGSELRIDGGFGAYFIQKLLGEMGGIGLAHDIS
jgi:3-oxoacyl-[acyl-carrier protein] reductase